MESLPCSLTDVTAALARGATVVTGNQRATRTLRGVYSREHQAAGARTWLTPALLPWEAWTGSLWQRLVQDGAEERMLLNAMQEHMLWGKIIGEDKDLPATLRSPESLASLSASAWELLGQYGGVREFQRVATRPDTQAFVRWAAEFARRGRDEKLLSGSHLEEELRTAMERGHLKIQGEIVLLGFERLTPAQSRLVEACKSSGGTLKIVTLQHDAVSREETFITAANLREELRAAAKWAREKLAASPEMQLALIVPNLDEDRAEIERTLRDVLAPELHDIAATAPIPYEFSLGPPLSSSAMAMTAIELLRWTVAPLPVERIGALLLSPYFAPGGDSERNARAELDAFHLRRLSLLRPQLSLRSVLQEAASKQHLAATTRALAAMQRCADERGLTGARKRAYGEWMEDARELLRAAGWPGERALDSTEFQLRKRWENAVDSVATLDFAEDRVSFSQALDALEHTLRETRFAPESRNAPVQVMGVIESAGSLFDAIWFLRGSDTSWPLPPKPHPLLAWQLQQRFAMPGADPQRAQQDARETVERIRHSAPQVLFSYAEQNRDGPQRRSPVIAELDWPAQEAASLLPAESLVRVELETVPDEGRLPLLPDRVIAGGAEILKLQAACGFRAFAEKRLWATELNSAETGLDASERGMLVHEIMERFWTRVRTQDALRTMPPMERTSLLTECIDAALRKTAHPDTNWDIAYLQAQRQRLLALLSAWLEVELTRPPFEVRLSEKDFDDVAVGPLRLNLRVDRIDRVEGGEVLIDYKTGRATVASWTGARPDEPQLPLYAVFAGSEHLQAVAFAQLRAGNEMKLEGYDAGNGMLPNPAKLKNITLVEQLAQWREVLEKLAREFAAGHAQVTPKNYPMTCRYCSQRLLCRLDTAALEGGENDPAEERHG